jgi:hypothetical protein
LIIDELTVLGQHVPTGENPLADLLDEFMNVYMRNHHIYFTCAHQSIYQVDEKLRQTLFSLGTHLCGRPGTIQEARELGDLLWKKDPLRVKHYHKTWGKVDPPPLPRYSYSGYSRYMEQASDFRRWQSPDFPYYVLDTDPGEYISLDDQREEAANLLLELGLFEFFLRPSLREGEVSSTVSKVTIADFLQDKATGEYRFPDQDVVAGVRSLLETTAGMPVQTLLAEQDALIPKAEAVPRPKQPGTALASQQPSADAAPTLPLQPPQPHHQRRRRIA